MQYSRTVESKDEAVKDEQQGREEEERQKNISRKGSLAAGRQMADSSIEDQPLHWSCRVQANQNAGRT
jgi:hypothetical protein